MDPILQFFKDLDKVFRVSLENQKNVLDLSSRVNSLEGAGNALIANNEQQVQALQAQVADLTARLDKITGEMQKIAETEYVEAQ